MYHRIFTENDIMLNLSLRYRLRRLSPSVLTDALRLAAGCVQVVGCALLVASAARRARSCAMARALSSACSWRLLVVSVSVLSSGLRPSCASGFYTRPARLVSLVSRAPALSGFRGCRGRSCLPPRARSVVVPPRFAAAALFPRGAGPAAAVPLSSLGRVPRLASPPCAALSLALCVACGVAPALLVRCAAACFTCRRFKCKKNRKRFMRKPKLAVM